MTKKIVSVKKVKCEDCPKLDSCSDVASDGCVTVAVK